MTGPERKAAYALHWDGTITAGNVLTALAMFVGILVWGMRLEGRVDASEMRQAQFEQLSRERRTEDLANAAEALRDVKASLVRIENHLRPQPHNR